MSGGLRGAVDAALRASRRAGTRQNRETGDARGAMGLRGQDWFRSTGFCPYCANVGGDADVRGTKPGFPAADTACRRCSTWVEVKTSPRPERGGWRFDISDADARRLRSKGNRWWLAVCVPQIAKRPGGSVPVATGAAALYVWHANDCVFTKKRVRPVGPARFQWEGLPID